MKKLKKWLLLIRAETANKNIIKSKSKETRNIENNEKNKPMERKSEVKLLEINHRQKSEVKLPDVKYIKRK